MKQKNSEYIKARCPPSLKQAVKRYVEVGPYMSTSDLIRYVVKEKLEENAPEILEEETKKWKKNKHDFSEKEEKAG